jgi:hypothetical protein
MLTLNQATAVMAAGIPVKCRGMEYLRIIGVSKKLSEHNVVLPSVAMEDRTRRTFYHGNPAEVTMHGEVNGIYYELVGNEVRAVRGVVDNS